MRLRSIPPKTIRTLLAQQAGPTTLGSLSQIRHDLGALRERLEQLDSSNQPQRLSPHLSAGVQMGRFITRPSARREPSSPSFGRHGRIYRRPAGPTRSPDVVIPPRQEGHRGVVSHVVEETADEVVVRITCPTSIRPEEIRWELTGDVLEVEHLGRSFSYFHAFLVPPDIEPAVEHSDRGFAFHFRRGT